MNPPIIAWSKTGDPYETMDEIQHKDDDILPDEDEGIEEEESELKNNKNMAVYFTPVGIVPLNEYTDVYKLFNFWTGNTNFGLTKPLSKIIEETPGVEILHIFTRYRLRIAIGKMFKAREVCYEIGRRVREYFAAQSNT